MSGGPVSWGIALVEYQYNKWFGECQTSKTMFHAGNLKNPKKLFTTFAGCAQKLKLFGEISAYQINEANRKKEKK